MLTRFSAVLVIAACLCGSAVAQYQPPPGGGNPGSGAPGAYTPPASGYGHGAAIGIAAAAVGGAVVAYLVLHNHGVVDGCVQRVNGGLALMNESNHQAYVLDPGTLDIQPGERLDLQGKKVKSPSGKITLQVQKIVKNLGSCPG